MRVAIISAVGLTGLFAGTGGFTFVQAKGASYLSDNPETCVNCHVMREPYDGWRRASHHDRATCNDCHLPHGHLLARLYVKASNGFRHSRAFTLQNFAEPIRIVPSNSKVLEDNCLRCHAEMIDAITSRGTLGVNLTTAGQTDLHGCVRCHLDVGHGPRR